MWRTLAAVALGAVALSGQAPLRPTPHTPPRDQSARPARPAPAANVAEVATAAIRGRVVADGSEVPVPLPKARVALNGGADPIEPIFTDASGRFEFGSLPAGRYTLSAEKTGYTPTRYGARSRFDAVQPIELTAGAVEEVEIRMPKGAAIFGRILDELGDPVVGARVSASVLRVEGTNRRLETLSRVPAETDDLGDYRIGGLPAGRYLLNISGQPGSMAISPASFGRRIGWGRTFYPSGTSATGATPIELAAGEERGGTDLTIVPFKPAELSVTISTTTPDPPMPANPAEAVRMGIDPRTLQTMATTNLMFLQADEPDMTIAGSQRMGFATAGGGSSSAGPTVSIDPGEWVVIARRGNTSALAHITVSSGDVATLTLPLTPGARFAGRILFEGPTRHPPPSSVRLDVIGAGRDANISPLVLAQGGPFTAKADGTFEISGVIGTVEIVVADQIGWAVKSVMAGDRDILGVPIPLQGAESFSDLRVVFTDQVAELSGSVAGADSQPTPGCSIAVFPSGSDATYSARRMRLARANQRGEFRFEDLPAGSYVAAAWTDIDPGTWTTPDSLDRLRAGATPFTIADREKKTMTLPCVNAQ